MQSRAPIALRPDHSGSKWWRSLACRLPACSCRDRWPPPHNRSWLTRLPVSPDVSQTHECVEPPEYRRSSARSRRTFLRPRRDAETCRERRNAIFTGTRSSQAHFHLSVRACLYVLCCMHNPVPQGFFSCGWPLVTDQMQFVLHMIIPANAAALACGYQSYSKSSRGA